MARLAITSLAFMLVEVPRAGLEDVDDELVVERAVDRPPAPRATIASASAWSSRPSSRVDLRRGQLDLPERADERRVGSAGR